MKLSAQRQAQHHVLQQGYESITLRKISQSEKDKDHMISLIYGI